MIPWYFSKVFGERNQWASSISRGTSSASAMNTFDHFVLVQICLWHSANTRCPVGVVLRLNALHTAQPFESRLFPFGNQIGICVPLSDAKLKYRALDLLLL